MNVRDSTTVRILAFTLFSLATRNAQGQTGEHVLLVVNDTSPVSQQIGDYYARKRGVPAAQILRLSVPDVDEITRPDFDRQLEAPIAAWLSRHSAQDRILYIVLTKGIPLRVAGTTGRSGTVASVDSELALLYRKLTGLPVPPTGSVANPYFLGGSTVAHARKFSHEVADIFLVSRLDGFSAVDVLALIDRAGQAQSQGQIVLDQTTAWDDKRNEWLRAAAETLRANGFPDRVVLDATSRALTQMANVLGYYSWGSNDPEFRDRRLNLGFVAGALAATYVSSDARTFTEPPAAWTIGAWDNRNSYFAGSPQSLTGDLIRSGVTGAAGQVAEPFLDAIIRPDILFSAYLAGFNLAEAYYLAMPALSWQTIVVGDPLCAPFRTKPLSGRDIDPGLDPATELPVWLAARRLAAVSEDGLKAAGLKLMLRAEARLAKQDPAGARQALEEATAAEERLNQAHTSLAEAYELAGEHDKAMDRYRRILVNAPDDTVVLNNLAFALAVRRKAPAEALPLAQRAYTLSQGDAAIADTLGWIYHLMGDDREAAKLMEEAVAGVPEHPEIRLRAAIVYAALGRPEASLEELTRALQLAPDLVKREEVKQLREKLGGGR